MADDDPGYRMIKPQDLPALLALLVRKAVRDQIRIGEEKIGELIDEGDDQLEGEVNTIGSLVARDLLKRFDISWKESWPVEKRSIEI
jgi:hypothetical protein